MFDIQRGELAAEQLQALDLVFERRQRVRRPPDIDLQPLETESKGILR
jgi:hypothetical protein